MEILKKINNQDFYYSIYHRKKKNGKLRTITAPDDKLKQLQFDFIRIFNNKINNSFGDYVTGFRKGYSIKDNATKHLNKKWVINLDIKNFFPSISKNKIIEILMELNIQKFKNYDLNDLAEILTLKNKLPQGSPASPIIANYVAVDLVDKRVLNFIKDYDFEYTRYADDLTLSTNKEYTRSELKDIIFNLISILEENSIFKIARHKIKLLNQGQRQEVTGIVVNQNYSVNRKERMRLRAAIHQINIGRQIMTPQLQGKLSFINQVNPELFKKLTKELKV